MCGIALELLHAAQLGDGPSAVAILRPALETGLHARGPDHLGTQQVDAALGHAVLRLTASLLQLRGRHPCVSPSISEQGHVLCFNGEIFGGLDVPPGTNDGARVLRELAAAGDAVPEVLGPIRGPWALLFWDPNRQRLWFGRDVLGRRSLLVHWPDAAEPRLLMSSVSELGTASMRLGAANGSQRAQAQGQGQGQAEAEAQPDGQGRAGAVAATDSAAASGGGQEDGDEPSGSDGFWTELPPGLYSIDLGLSMGGGGFGGHGSAEAVSSGGPAVSGRGEETVNSAATGNRWQCIHTKFILPADTRDAAGAADAGRNGGGSSRSDGGSGCSAAGSSGGDLQLCVLRHGWRDPLLRELEAYRRAESLLPTAACSSAESAYCGAGADTDSGAEAAAAGGADALEAAAVTAGEAHGARGAGAAAHRWAADDAAALVRPMSLPRSPDIASHVDQLAVGLLNVMLAAIRVRCACIEPRSPHPSAAYGAAVAKAAAAAAAATTVAAEGSGCPPWPSWRASDPQAYNAAAVAMPTGAVASVTPAAGAVAGGAAPLAPQPPPPVMILFSGGVDSVLLAALAHRALPLDFPIDLCNVCFDGGKSPDRGAARCALRELAQACPGRPWRLLEVDATLEDVDRHKMRILSLLRPAHTVMDLNIGAALWLAASGQGNLRLPPPPPCHSVADAATVPAAAAAEGPASTSGEALRVAGSRAAASAGSGGSNDPSNEEVLLPYYGSPARVVLLGHGADEQCGGYGRHRTRFRLGSSEPRDGAAAAVNGADGCVGDEGATASIGEAGGWRALAAELELDVRRLWIRNLGRDDRLVSDWGREARHPFLDESVMQLLRRARLSSVVDFSQPPGRGDKQVLRRALALLGLPEAASRVKRAIQFGSRIGKQHNRREFGSNRAANRQNAGGVALQDVTKAAAEAVSKAWVKPPKGQRGG